MRELIIESMQYIDIECATSNHKPNEETIKALEESQQSKNLITGKEAKKITKKLELKKLI